MRLWGLWLTQRMTGRVDEDDDDNRDEDGKVNGGGSTERTTVGGGGINREEYAGDGREDVANREQDPKMESRIQRRGV